jgi:D-alanyl-D-alanine carboxypeptidase
VEEARRVLSSTSLLVLVLLLWGHSADSEAAISAEVDSTLQAVLDQQSQSYAGVGAAMAVTLGDYGTWVGATGLSDLATSAPMQPDDVFCIASITKTFVAATVLQLAEEGVLSLDDPIERWLPGMVSGGSEISIRMLLNHTSGLYDTDADSELHALVAEDPSRTWDPEVLVAMAVAHPPHSAPGEEYWYSNTNFIVAGLIAQEATGTGIAPQIRARFLGPLGLTNTFFAVEEPGAHLPLHGHDSSLNAITASTAELSSMWAAGAMVSCASDLVRWADALYGGQVLQPESRAAMFGDLLGLQVLPGMPLGAMYGHPGHTPGYLTYMYHVPERGLSVVLLANSDAIDILGMSTDALNQMRRSSAITTRLVKSFPQDDLAILTDQLAGVTTENSGGAQPPQLTSAGPVFAGQSAMACDVAPAGLAGWRLAFHLPQPVDPFAYTSLRFALHPGTAKGRGLSVAFGSRSASLLGIQRVEGTSLDLTLQEWQVTEVPLDAAAISDSFATVAFTGSLTGTFYLDEISLIAATPPPARTAVLDGSGAALPDRCVLGQNYPNPFNSDTVIRLALPQLAKVELVLYNLAGQQVATLAGGTRQAGAYTVTWDGRDDQGRALASGVYLYHLRAGAQEQTRKLLLLR